MEMFYPVDRVMAQGLNPALPIVEIQELNDQMCCNTIDCNNYFDKDTLPEHVSIVDEMEMFMRDAESEAWNG